MPEIIIGLPCEDIYSYDIIIVYKVIFNNIICDWQY